jgi:hypothetical protein
MIRYILIALLIIGTAHGEQVIRKGEYALIAYADVLISDTMVVLTIKNTLKMLIYVPKNFESKNIQYSRGDEFGIDHGDGGKVSFPDDYVILKPGKTRNYHFSLDEPLDKKTKYEFSIWAPIRDRKNWRTIIKKKDVVYKVIGIYPETPNQKFGVD